MKAQHEQEIHAFSFGRFRLDLRERVLLRDGAPISLLPKSFDALVVLVRNSGRVLQKEFLLNEIWPDTAVEENSLAKAISDIRRALGEGPKDQQYIVTVPRLGYRFAASVTPVSEMSPHGGKATAGAPAGAESGHAEVRPLAAVAVLPFLHIGPGEGAEYLGVGLADALITRLSNLSRIVVRPTSSILRYANGATGACDAGRALKANAVVSGGIRQAGDRIRVTVQLVEVEGERALWAGTFDEPFTDVFAVEDSISERVATALSPRLTGEERALLTRRHTRSPEAHQLYLRGRYFFSKRTAADLRQAIACFRRAIELDPQYALAYAGLADCHIMFSVHSALFGGNLAPRETYPEARRMAVRAIELDDMLAEPHASMGHVKFFLGWDWPGAEASYRRSIELNSQYVSAHHWYAMSLSFVGRFDEAIVQIEIAQELEPLSLILSSNAGYILYHARRFEEAVAQLRETVKMDPAFVPTHHRLGLALEALGRCEEAIAEFETIGRLSGDSPVGLAALAHACAVAGRAREAEEILGRLEAQRAADIYIGRVNLAEVHAALGRTDRALDELEIAIEERDASLTRLGVNPRWDRLRAHPRLQAIQRRIGLWP